MLASGDHAGCHSFAWPVVNWMTHIVEVAVAVGVGVAEDMLVGVIDGIGVDGVGVDTEVGVGTIGDGVEVDSG